MKRILWLVTLTVTFALSAVFAYLNSMVVSVDFLGGQAEAPLVVWLFLSLIVGVLLALLVSWMRSFGTRAELRQLKQRLERVDAELKTFRGLDLKDS